MNLIAILHNIRSAHNVGSMFRTADGAGVEKIFLTGYTLAPAKKNAPYLTRAEKDMAKTALGAEQSVPWKKYARLATAVAYLKEAGYTIVALEQSPRSISYDTYQPQYSDKVALLVGTEVSGLSEAELELADTIMEIPMRGAKESLNVSVAFGIAVYQITSTMKGDSSEDTDILKTQIPDKIQIAKTQTQM